MILNLVDLSSEPLYIQISRQIRGLILRGDLEKGESIPSIRDLARTHKVSVITVQKAYDELVRDGLIVARRGKGYFVADLAQQERSDFAEAHCKELLREPIHLALQEGVKVDALHRIIDRIIQEHVSNNPPRSEV